MDFIFWYENKEIYNPELPTLEAIPEVKGLLYCYSLKQFVFCNSSTFDKPSFQTFLLYDYTIPNIIKRKNGLLLFYLDNALNIKYQRLCSDIKILTNWDCNKDVDVWHKVIFTNVSSSDWEKKNTIIINNSVFLSNIINYSTLGHIIYMDSEKEAIKFIVSKRFDRRLASKMIVPHISDKRVHYLFVDDCCTIKTYLSEYGEYTLLVPRSGDKLDLNLSFNSYKKFIIFRREKNNAWYEHLLLKCLYNDLDGTEKVAYIDITNLEIVTLEDLIDDAFNYE